MVDSSENTREPIKLSLPIDEETVRGLNAGDAVLISGRLVTGRDRLHKHLSEQKPGAGEIPFELKGTVLYHVGPILREAPDVEGGYEIISAGPTTSARMKMYEPWVIERYGLRGVMGKGGMDAATHEAMKKFGAVYFHTIGGAGAYLADRICKVLGGWHIDDFGMAEAMWHLEVKDFPALVTMDTKGSSLHEEIERLSEGRLKELL